MKTIPGWLHFAATLLACDTQNAVRQARVDAWRDQTIAVDGGDSLHVVHRGTARSRVLVFIPGLSDTWSSYQQLADALPDTFGIVLIDPLGHGRSTKYVGTSNPRRQSSAIRAALDSLGVTPFAMIGHSYGGLIAQYYGIQHAELPAAVLIATLPTMQGHPAAADWDAFARSMPDTVPDEILAGQASSFFAAVPDSVVAPYIAASRQTPGHVWREVIVALLEDDTRPFLSAWQPRTLLIMVESDKVIGDWPMARLVEALPRADTVRIPRTSHAPHWERPDTVAAVIRSFLATLPGS